MRNSRVRKSFEQAELPLAPAPDNLAGAVRDALSFAVRRSRRSVAQIADGMSFRLGQNITEHMLYSKTADSHASDRFPLEWTAAFCRETGDLGVLRVVLSALGLPLPEPGDAELIRLAKARIQSELLSREASGIEAQVLRRNIGVL